MYIVLKYFAQETFCRNENITGRLNIFVEYVFRNIKKVICLIDSLYGMEYDHYVEQSEEFMGTPK